MVDGFEVKGGVSEFEAAVIAVVLDKITREEREAQVVSPDRGPGLSAWVRALVPEDSRYPSEAVRPEKP